MAKRFTDTELWDDDWFIGLPLQYKMFWFYIKDDCDHAGIWKPKKYKFQLLTDLSINIEDALIAFNEGKERIKVLNEGRWYIVDFFHFQYGDCINISSKVHESAVKTYLKEGLPLSSVHGIKIWKLNKDTTTTPTEIEVKLRSS